MDDRSARQSGGTVHDLSDALTAALTAAAGRAGDANAQAYHEALSLARTARSADEIRAAIQAARAVGRGRTDPAR